MLEGQEPDERYPVPLELRDWKLAKTFGWTWQEIQDQPAVWVDWLLQIEGTASEIQARRNSGRPSP